MAHPRTRSTSLLGALIAATALFPSATASAAPTPQDVVLIGNSAAGTVTFLDGHTFQSLGTLNVIPDRDQRLREMDLVQAAGYAVVRQQEGGDRFVDDVYASPDGRTLYVSRGNLDDAAAFDIATGRQLWHHRLPGFKADHAALSPDGTRFVVSATTAALAQVLDTATGLPVGSFGTGTYPHQNDYSADGRHIYNSSIGVTALPKALDGLKGDKRLTVVDANTLQVTRTYEFDEGVRPFVVTPDESTMYTQLSYLNGFVEFDLRTGRTTRTVAMPYSAAGQALRPDDYPQNSAHHGMALSGDGAKLCDVGTIDDYTAVLSRPGLTTDGFVGYPTNSLPYWATTSADGQHCLVTLSHANAVSVVDYRTATEVARIPVGDFPQRERLARAVLPAP
ncbi:YncE family protein [Solihabitans fulvus]|uniref:YncE family protein n=1 Tax=Solihabitans fulvus TaxID=1892852 RepID=A0A5B2X5V1_9PSEU|nr:YncE family protein [Solihabitans fulvus]KAA2258600.1 YncE family protein [Solihabitans fulvus]